MDSAATLRLIYRRALRARPDDALLYTPPAQLVAAFGAAAASRLAGRTLDPAAAARDCVRRRQTACDALDAEIREVQQLSAAGHQVGGELGRLLQKLERVRGGALQTQAVAAVRCGDLRVALETADHARDQRPAPPF